MQSVRITEFTAAEPENRARLAELVRDGQRVLARAPELLRCELLFDADNPDTLVAIEAWSAADVRQQYATDIPGETVEEAIKLMGGHPKTRNFTSPPELHTDAPDAGPGGD